MKNSEFGIQESELSKCGYCGKSPKIEHDPESTTDRHYIIACEDCAEKSEQDYPSGPMAYAWVSTFPWDDFVDAKDEWETAVKFHSIKSKR